MKRFTRTRLIGSIAIGPFVFATAAGTAMAAAPPSDSGNAPTVCDHTTPPTPGTPSRALWNTPDVTGDPYGLEGLLADALSKVCLSEDQRGVIDQLGREISAKEQPVVDAQHAFVVALAEQLRSGDFDASSLEPKIDALVKAREAAGPVVRKTLVDLHGMLDPGQRVVLVGALEERMKELAGASGAWPDSLAEDIGLSGDQKQRLQVVLSLAQADLRQDRDRTTAVFEAFKKPDFPLEKISPESDVGPRTRARAQEMVRIGKPISEILTPEQRGRLADDIAGRTTGETSTSESPETVQQGLYTRYGGYRVGTLRGWGDGYAGATYWGLRTGYVAGYPFVGGYTPGIW